MKLLKTSALFLILAVAFTACSPYATTGVSGGVSVGTGYYGPRPYYRPYAYRPYYRPRTVVVPQRRVIVRPHPGYRNGFKNGYRRGYWRGRGGRW
jgi:hypothetical protein